MISSQQQAFHPTISGPDPNVMEAINRGNDVVFFDITLGGGDDKNRNTSAVVGSELGRIKLELFVKDVGFEYMYISNPDASLSYEEHS